MLISPSTRRRTTATLAFLRIRGKLLTWTRTKCAHDQSNTENEKISEQKGWKFRISSAKVSTQREMWNCNLNTPHVRDCVWNETLMRWFHLPSVSPTMRWEMAWTAATYIRCDIYWMLHCERVNPFSRSLWPFGSLRNNDVISASLSTARCRSWHQQIMSNNLIMEKRKSLVRGENKRYRHSLILWSETSCFVYKNCSCSMNIFIAT